MTNYPKDQEGRGPPDQPHLGLDKLEEDRVKSSRFYYFWYKSQSWPWRYITFKLHF